MIGKDSRTHLLTANAMGYLTGHRSAVRAAAITSDGTRAVTSSWGRTVVWDLATGTKLHDLRGHYKVWAMAGRRRRDPGGHRRRRPDCKGVGPR